MMDIDTILSIPMAIMAWTGAVAFSSGLLFIVFQMGKELINGTEWFMHIRRTSLQRDYLARELAAYTKKDEIFWLRKARELA